eukprot:6200877-Pleurochrysis_carterae.AAC.1
MGDGEGRHSDPGSRWRRGCAVVNSTCPMRAAEATQPRSLRLRRAAGTRAGRRKELRKELLAPPRPPLPARRGA